MNDMPAHLSALHGNLVDAETLIRILWHPDATPSLRWIREQQKCRTIPFVKIGRRVFFDPVAVRAALNKRTVTTRS